MKFKSALVIIFLFILNIYVSSDVLEKEFKSQAYIVGEYVNLREKPTVKSKSIALLLDGTSCYCEKVTTLKEKLGKFENYWYYLNIGGTPISGWIYGQFVKFRDNDDEIVFNKEKYYKLFDRSIYPQSFNQIINKRWSDIKPGVKFDGERGGDEVVF